MLRLLGEIHHDAPCSSTHFPRANAFALFLKSQRKWVSPELKESSVLAFKARMKTFGYSASHILPHGSYLINLGNPDEYVPYHHQRIADTHSSWNRNKREQSFECFVDDLKRCEQLGLQLYNFQYARHSSAEGSLIYSCTQARGRPSEWPQRKSPWLS